VEGHDGDVRFKNESGNAVVPRKHNASGHNYRNSSVIVDLAMGYRTQLALVQFLIYRKLCRFAKRVSAKLHAM